VLDRVRGARRPPDATREEDAMGQVEGKVAIVTGGALGIEAAYLHQDVSLEESWPHNRGY
jgi:hypothetical protein